MFCLTQVSYFLAHSKMSIKNSRPCRQLHSFEVPTTKLKNKQKHTKISPLIFKDDKGRKKKQNLNILHPRTIYPPFALFYLLKTCIWKKLKLKSSMLMSINPFTWFSLKFLQDPIFSPFPFLRCSLPLSSLLFISRFFLYSLCLPSVSFAALICWTPLQITIVQVFMRPSFYSLFCLCNTSFLWLLSASPCSWLPNLVL